MKTTEMTEYDVHLFKEGTHYALHNTMGAHIGTRDGKKGVSFSVWAPNAESVAVIGDFNGWNSSANPLDARRDGSGIWEGFVPGLKKGAVYKYAVKSKEGGQLLEKGDPFAFYWEEPPKTGAIVWDHEYSWKDAQWMKRRGEANALDAPVSMYEIHFGSWRRKSENGNSWLSYREMADYLPDYLVTMGYTHVEMMPLTEHPFYGSWGYQTTGYFAPTSRYGTPEDFMYLVDRLHQAGVGIVLDWVPSHFPGDLHGLHDFDGTQLYEHRDPREGYHPDWNSYIFNYGRNEVKEFLISNALFWLEKYHIDGLRVDAVASMLYRDYSRKEGEWVPNKYGGRENLEAIQFMKDLNEAVYTAFPDVQTIAEESTSWPMVSRPTYLGGLGFGMKWNMGWMHDTLEYFSKDPLFRKYHHDELSFSLWYAFSENFLLSLSHDEVVHGKGSLLNKMPGDDWQKYANLRLLYGFMFAHPGKKLLFMGGEIGQRSEWNHESSVDWHLLNEPLPAGLQRWVRDLNQTYRREPALYRVDFQPEGFEWVDTADWENSIISFYRKDPESGDRILVVCNLTPATRTNYHIGVGESGFWKEILNSDAAAYGGSNSGNGGGMSTVPVESHGQFDSLSLTLPPLAVLMLKHDSGGGS
ncbi:1,4-alpha-glucan branching protein GlgB [Salinispira pacifica]